MPRIDPIRLLSCLKPLLNLETGGIKTDREVDKVFVLMTKFSKKLVSKCTYINILLATPSNVLNLFMERGGWEMIFNWVVEAKGSKHHVLLNEILKLLLVTPTSVERLKTNSLPKEIKQISSKWESEETKSLAEQVVASWISIARNVDSGRQSQTTVQVQTPQHANQSSTSFEMQNLGVISDESAINSNLTDNIIYESETPQNLDMDVDNFDLAEMMDFNPDLFTKTIDMHLSELNANEGDKPVQIANNAAIVDNVQQQPVHVLSTTSQSIPAGFNTIHTVTSNNAPVVPRIVIKKSGGQRSVVSADGTQIIAQPSDAKERLCVVTLNGQKVLMRFRVADEEEAGALTKRVEENVLTEPEVTQDQQVTSSVSSTPEATPTETKRKRPRKDPTMSAIKNAAQNVDSVDSQPKLLKTYSKKTNAELNNIVKASTSSKDVDGKVALKLKSTPTSSGGSSPAKISSPSGTSKRSSAKSHSSSSKSAAAAAAAAEAERAEKLRRQVMEQKKKLKERMEEGKKQDKKKAEDDKQKQKDSDTLKEVYGAPTPVNSVKIPKKPRPSFTDLIGVPGSSEDTKKEKVTKEKIQEGEAAKGGKPKTKEDESSGAKEEELQDATGLGPFTRPESKEIGPAKERRHQIKVYTSSKSKGMDLLETMTKSTKVKAKIDLDLNKPETKPEKGNAVSFEDALAGGSSAAMKPAKRPSIDSGKSTSESKKLKLDESVKSSDKKDKSKNKSKDEEKKSKEKKSSSTGDKSSKKPQVIQESSLFMDAITATSSKIKRKRRISSSGDAKEKESVVSASNGNVSDSGANSNKTQQPMDDGSDKLSKPLFNFYRDTLNDDDGPPPTLPDATEESNVLDTSDEVTILEDPAEPVPVEDAIADDFAPVEGEGKLKSALCIHRPKGKPKKAVRWREEEELKEFHYFEMDETERINVTKQSKNFSEMRLMEKSEEKLLIRRKYTGETPPVEKFEWMKLRRIDPEQLSGQPDVTVKSQEKTIQDERERSILEVFYFPGTTLPEHPSEEYIAHLDIDHIHPPKTIPSEDIPVLTKVSDYRNTPWPLPRIAGQKVSLVDHKPQPKIIEPVANLVPNPLANADPTNAFANPYNAASNPGGFDAFNPWTQSYDLNTQSNDPWKAAQDVQNFGAFPVVAPNVPPAVNAFQALPFGFPFPPQIGAPVPPMGQIQPTGNFSGFGPPVPNHFDPSQHQVKETPHHGSRHPPGRPNRDVDYRDAPRRNDRDRDDRDGRNRDTRPGRDRDRDNRDRGRDRDRYDKERDYRNHDRRRPGGRRATLCNYFSKGFCREGNKCAFLHPGVNGPPAGDGPSNNGSNSFSRHKPSPPPNTNNRFEDRRRSPPQRDLSHNSSAALSSSSGGPREIPEIESPTPDTETRFMLPPSSPNEHQSFSHGAEAVKVIPTFTEEDWV